MFCNKCGKQLPDNATFCSGCGNQVGAAPAAPAAPKAAAPANLPPILSRLFSQVANFFTKKDPVGVVANSAKDTSFSGAILLGLGFIVTALACMINFNQMLNYLLSSMLGGMKIPGLSKYYPSGVTFGMSLLASVVIGAASVAMVFLALKKINKKDVTLSGAINLVAYSSIPLVCVFIVNMLVGLIWMPLTFVLTALAAVMSLLTLYSAFRKAGEFEKAPYFSFLIVAGVITLVTIIFTYLWINAGIKGVGDNLSSLFGSIF